MKLLEYLKFGQRAKPLPPIRTIREPGVARKAPGQDSQEPRLEEEAVAQPAAKTPPVAKDAGRAVEAPPVRTGPNKPREIDPIFEDTGSLEIEQEDEEHANPYDTQSWQVDPRAGIRRVDTLKGINRKADKNKKEVTNPYDTGIIRKGW